MSDEPARMASLAGGGLSDLYNEYRTAQIARLAMEASELAHRVERLGGLDGDRYTYARKHDAGPGAWCVRGPNGFEMYVPGLTKDAARLIGEVLSGCLEAACGERGARFTGGELMRRLARAQAERAAWSGPYPWRQCTECCAQIHVGGRLLCDDCVNRGQETEQSGYQVIAARTSEEAGADVGEQAVWRAGLLEGLAMAVTALEQRVVAAGGLDGEAGLLRLVRSGIEQKAQMERASEPAPP